jgi:hypothetical protein
MQSNGHAPHVRLGEHDYAVYPQKIGYLENKLGRFIEALTGDSATSTDSIVDFLGDKAYDVLHVFLPRLMPEYEFRGYRSQEAFDARDYDPEGDASPSFPEIVEAMQTCMRVNRFDLFGHLGKLVDEETRGALVAMAVARSTGGLSPTESSTTTPPTTSTDSGTTAPTLTASAA